MNKLWLLLSVLVIALFVVSCAPKEVIEGEEGAEEVGEEGGALAGQAVHKTKKVVVPCKDTDNPQNLIAEEINSYFVKGTVTAGNAPIGGIVDSCTGVGSHILEGTCKSNKYVAIDKECNALSSEGAMTCKDGVCVPDSVDVTACEKVGGDDPYSKGELYVNEYVASKEAFQIDACLSKKLLFERTCNLVDHQRSGKIYDCNKNGGICINSACVKCPGPTGDLTKLNCNINTSGTFYQEEFCNAGSAGYSTYLSFKYCGPKVDSCAVGIGCK